MKKKSKISGYILRGTVAALLLSCVTIGLSSAINVTNDTPEASASEHNTAFGVNAHEGAASAEASAIQKNSTLTFADRVAYQRAIEEVYWRHRIWPAQRPDPKPSLDAVMSQAQLEKKSRRLSARLTGAGGSLATGNSSHSSRVVRRVNGKKYFLDKRLEARIAPN
jgi:hypothetical protein